MKPVPATTVSEESTKAKGISLRSYLDYVSNRLSRNRVEMEAVFLLWAGITVFAIIYGTLSIIRVNTFQADAFDLGIFDQTLWQISHFHSLFNTVRGLNLFGDHFTPILFLIAPLYRLFPEPQALVFFQSAALAIGAAPLYRLARHHSSPPFAATGLCFAYLIAPTLAYPILYDFHPNMLAIPLLLFAIDAMEQERYKAFAAWTALTLICRQDMAPSVGVFGLAIVLRSFSLNASSSEGGQALRRRRKIRAIAGVITLLAGTCWLFLALSVMQALSGGGTGYAELYRHFGSTPGRIAANLLLHPISSLSYAVYGNGYYILQLVMPTGLICLLCPELLIATLPELALNLLSDKIIMQTIWAQYTPAITPFVFASAAIGLGRLFGFTRRFDLLPRPGENLGGIVLASISAFCFWSYGPGDNMAHIWRGFLPSSVVRERRALLAKNRIPQSASVSASWGMVVSFDHRDRIYMFPNPFIKAWYGPGKEVIEAEVMNAHTPMPPKLTPLLRDNSVDYLVITDPGPYQRLITKAISSGYYRVVAKGGGVTIFKRVVGVK